MKLQNLYSNSCLMPGILTTFSWCLASKHAGRGNVLSINCQGWLWGIFHYKQWTSLLVKFYPTEAGFLCDKVALSRDTINGTPYFRRPSPRKLMPEILVNNTKHQARTPYICFWKFPAFAVNAIDKPSIDLLLRVHYSPWRTTSHLDFIKFVQNVSFWLQYKI